MNDIEILQAINQANASAMPQWKIDLLAARQDIVAMLLTDSYYELGLTPPTEDIIVIRSAQIANKADVCNRDLKAAFAEAVDAKMDKDIKQPITYGDINKAAAKIAQSNNKSVIGKWKNALPMLKDTELWGDSVVAFAKSHGKDEFAAMLNAQKRLTDAIA